MQTPQGQQATNQRSRTVPANQTQAPTNTQGGVSSPFQSGAAGMAQSQRETAMNAARFESSHSFDYTNRFWLQKNSEATIIVLDQFFTDPNGGAAGLIFAHEHQFRNPRTGKYDAIELCPRDYDVCPICDGRLGYDAQNNRANSGYYAMFLSVIDTRPYTKQSGENVPFSRKLLVVKRNSHSKFFDLFNAMQQETGGIRGMALKLRRGNGAQEPSHGEPVIVKDGRMYVAAGEQFIQQRFQHAEVKNKDGVVIVPANGFQQPIDYQNMTTDVSNQGISQRWGLEHSAVPMAGAGQDDIFNTNPAPQQTQAPTNTQGGMVGQTAGQGVNPTQGNTGGSVGGGILDGLGGSPQQASGQAGNVQDVTHQQTDANGFPLDNFNDDLPL